MDKAPSHIAVRAETSRTLCIQAFLETRAQTIALTRSLCPEDMVLQAMPDASPARWHLAHTTWFFEEFLLKPHEPNFVPFDEQYGFLFNSYYEAIGERWPRAQRGLLSRPTADDILAYRQAVEERVATLSEELSDQVWPVFQSIIELGIHHEQQHQELLCTDIKAAFGLNPIFPAALPLPTGYDGEAEGAAVAANERWISFDGGLHEVGYDGNGFQFDNEGPRHKVWLEEFSLHGTPVTNGQFADFIADGGYQDPSLWLSDGWAWLNEGNVRCPLYWHDIDGALFEFSLHGLLPLRRDRILSHVSAYEAFAYAKWANARLPTEMELEIALRQSPEGDGQFLDPLGFIHPHLVGRDQGLGSAYGTVWDWTQSAYAPFPGYNPPEGAIGEYNGKFMSSQLVLKGGSCATPRGHIRSSYRNFFPPDARWQFTGIRLARNA